VWDEITREGALFDALPDPEPIFKVIASEDVQLRQIFLTHDQSIEALRARFPTVLLRTSAKDALPQHRKRSNDFIHLGNLRITNRGLVDDKVAYVIGNWPEDAPHVAIVGDLADVPEAVIREKIRTLPVGTLLCPRQGCISAI